MEERQFLIAIIKEAAKLIDGKMDVDEKDSRGDLVTNFDYAVEKFLIAKIQEKYPDFTIISEEFNPNQETEGSYFTIDPIDGTINFAHNIPLWGMQVACVKNNKTIAAAIYLPKFDEMYSADKTGAYLNEQPIHVNNEDILHGVYNISAHKDIADWKKMTAKNMHVRCVWGSSIYHCWVASGKISAAFHDIHSNIWDITPGEFIVKQAGGVIFDVDNVRIIANSQSWGDLLVI